MNSVIIPLQELFLINSTLMIDCDITLNAPVGPGIQLNITWYHDMTNVTHYSSLMRSNVTVFTSTLSIQVSDAGVYQCNAGIGSNVTTKNIRGNTLIAKILFKCDNLL